VNKFALHFLAAMYFIIQFSLGIGFLFYGTRLYMTVTASKSGKSKGGTATGGTGDAEKSKAHQRLALGIFGGGACIQVFAFGTVLIMGTSDVTYVFYKYVDLRFSLVT
jgi:hypothetical protein